MSAAHNAFERARVENPSLDWESFCSGWNALADYRRDCRGYGRDLAGRSTTIPIISSLFVFLGAALIIVQAILMWNGDGDALRFHSVWPFVGTTVLALVNTIFWWRRYLRRSREERGAFITKWG